MTYRLGITALGKRATLSRRSKKDPRLAVGTQVDCHDDFISCVVEWLEGGKVDQVISSSTKTWTISCVEAEKP